MFTNYNLYGLFSYLCTFFACSGCVIFGVHIADENIVTFLFVIIFLLLSVIFGIYSTKYFNKTYQLKKNSKKIIKK